MFRVVLYSFLIILPLLQPCNIEDQDILPAAETITIAELRDHIFFLASDELEGRDTGSEGYRIAAQYAASQFRGAGLAPLLKNTAGDVSYFQPIDFELSSINLESTMRITKDGAEKSLTYGKDFVCISQISSSKIEQYEGTPVFLGYGIEEPELGWNDFENIDVSGRIVIVCIGAPTRNGKPVLPEEKHKYYSNLQNSLGNGIMKAAEHHASSMILIANQQVVQMWGMIALSLNHPAKRFALAEDFISPFPALYLLRPEAAAEMLSDAGFDPATGTGEYTPSSIDNVLISFDIKYDIEKTFSCNNVAAFVPGSDPQLKDEYIVVSAHLDHLGIQNDQVFNGADDNASGSAAVLEAAEAAAMLKPRRSIIFALYTGEESGLHGSVYFVENLPVPLEKVVLNINADMVGRNSPPFPEAVLAFASETMKSKLLDFVKEVNNSYVQANLDLSLNENDTYGHAMRSDQLSFDLKGVPFVLITRGFMQPDYHRPSDDPETINYDKVLKSAQLMLALAIEAANSETLFEK